MVAHEPGVRVATINGRPAVAIPMVTVPEDDVDFAISTLELMRDLVAGQPVRRLDAPPNQLTDVIARLRRAIGRKG